MFQFGDSHDLGIVHDAEFGAQYIGSFEYSLHPQTNFNSQKQRPLFLIMETAKSVIGTEL